MEFLNECTVIKYSAYRTAAKVLALQRAFRLEYVRLGIVSGVFYRHNLRPAQNQDIFKENELGAIVYDIIFAAQKETSHEINVALVTEQIVQFLYEVYNRQNRGLRIINAKVALTVLCCARLQEKYQYLFHQLADHNSCLTKKRMELLLTDLAEMAEYLCESTSFGSHLIPSTLNSCFQHCDGSLGVNEESFMCWLLNEPQTLVWLSTTYRLQAAEKVCHYVKCDFCKVYPIRGLRYMCLLCFKYNQCQTCFFLGRVNKRHKLKHPIQEYCYETSSKEATCAFLKVLRNKLRKHPKKDLLYLPAEPHDTQNKTQYLGEGTSSVCSIYHSNVHIADNELSSRTVINLYHQTVLPINPQNELQSVIHNLEEENRQLLARIEDSNDSKFGNYLHGHKEQIGAQVERLKLLKFHLAKVNEILPHKTLQYQNGYRQQLCRLESTPVIPKSVKNYEQAHPPDLDSISPIVKDTDRIAGLTDLPSWQCEQLEYNAATPVDSPKNNSSVLPSLSEHSVNDLSVCIYRDVGENTDCRTGISDWLQKIEPSQQFSEINEDIDSIIEKLQHVLSSNFSIQDALLSDQDNTQLQEAATEMEGLLAGLIKNIEVNKGKNVCNTSDCQIFV